MISQKIENLIVKYFAQSSNTEDLDVLNSWIKDEKNHQIFKEFIKTHFAITLAMNNSDIDKIKEELQKEIRKEKNMFYGHGFMSVMKYAAIGIFFLAVGIFWQQGIFKNDGNDIIVPRTDAITLQLDNGEIEIISEEGTSTVMDARGNVVGVHQGNKLVYDEGNDLKLVYNTLSVPNGKQFNIVLSDGTSVFLNSGSTIKYPVNFLKDSIRQVFFTGEAFFEVAHNTEDPFLVNTQGLKVKVHGTKFNVANYPEDNDTEVVLVDGSVSLTGSDKLDMDNGHKEIFLKPGSMGVFNKTDHKITQEDVNTTIYTSWMNGNLVFRNIPFKNIIQKLERHYNVVIINNNEKLGTETFNATIETKHETIEQVFNYFNKVYQIEYRIIENKIIIN